MKIEYCPFCGKKLDDLRADLFKSDVAYGLCPNCCHAFLVTSDTPQYTQIEAGRFPAWSLMVDEGVES